MIMMMRSILPAIALSIALGACGVPTISPEQAAQNAHVPGWTGSTFVAGSNSTVAGDAEATYQQQKWPMGRSR